MSQEPLLIPGSILAAIFQHAKDESPRECCGLLGGKGRRVESHHRLQNADVGDDATTHYEAEPKELIAAVRSIREGGGDIVAIYHSHPKWPAVPSKVDLRENYWGETPRPIVSLLTEPPTMRVWILREHESTEVPWTTLEDGIG
jgi:[CysO sulfur-carrier protein]-S-L-cysteine hydrolase